MQVAICIKATTMLLCKLSHQSSWQTNDAISPKQNYFGKVHTMHIFKSYKRLHVYIYRALSITSL